MASMQIDTRERDIFEHVAEEEDELFAVARDLLTPEQSVEIGLRMQREEARLRAPH